MHKKILVLLFVMFFAGIVFAQKKIVPPQDQRRHAVCLGVSGGMSVPFSDLSETQKFGGFGQADFFVFMSQNITVGIDYAYNYFPGKGNRAAVPFNEVVISGSYVFNPSWNPSISFGLGYLGEPHVGRLGFVPGIGVMPKIAKNIFFHAKASVVFFDNNGHFFKLGAGFVFQVYQFKTPKR